MSSADPQLVGPGSTDFANAPGRPLARRLAAFFFVTSVFLVMTSSGILYWATLEALKNADDQVIQKRAEDIANLLSSDTLDEAHVGHEVSEDNQGPRQIFIRIVTPFKPLQLETPTMSSKLPETLFPDMSAAPYQARESATITTPRGEKFRVLALRVPVTARPGPSDAIIQVATDTTFDEEGLSLFRQILLLVLGAAIPLCALASWLLVKRELEPLKRITAGAESIDSLTLDRRLSLTGLPAELHSLAASFNEMLDRLESAYKGLKQYADNIAHELRTPLNRMRLQSELALRHAKSAAEFETAMASNVEDCERLTQLLHGLLFLARAENRQASISADLFQLAPVLQALREFFEASAESSRIRLAIRSDDDLELRGDRELIQRAIANLIANAFDHTPAGGKINVEARRSASHIVVEVCDTGEGIAPKHLPRIFDRFYRAAQSPSANPERLGLGLAIAKSIVELHEGSITVDSWPDKGTTFTMIFAAPKR